MLYEKKLYRSPEYMEVHSEDSLMFDPTANENVPKHSRCNNEDFKLLKE